MVKQMWQPNTIPKSWLPSYFLYMRKVNSPNQLAGLHFAAASVPTGLSSQLQFAFYKYTIML